VSRGESLDAYWQRFRATSAGATAPEAWYDTMSIGPSAASADEGARLILAGIKTTTSSLPSDYSEAKPPPYRGAHSILLNGHGAPVAIVETTAVAEQRLTDIDADFASAYGEWDRTLVTWHKQMQAYYEPTLSRRGLVWSHDTRLLCEWLRVVWTG